MFLTKKYLQGNENDKKMNQMGMLKLKSSITKLKISIHRFNSILEQAEGSVKLKAAL